MNTVITKASKSDKKSLMRFYKQQSYSARLLGYDTTYLIKYSGDIIGAVIISGLEEKNPQLFLHALVIKKEFRQKRLASELIKHALFQHASQQIVCFADGSLTHFYQINGFSQITEHQLLQPLLTRYLSYRRSLPSTCMETLMQRRHGCLRAVMTQRHNVDVQGCTNALEDRMSEKGHPEHRRSLPSLATRHTVHPEHKKTNNELLVFSRDI